MNSLKEKALISNVTISVWGGKKFDRKVTKEVDEAHNTSKTGNFNKHLILPSYLQALITASGKIRTFHYANTLTWSDSGDRLLPAMNYLNYTQGIANLINEFRDLVKQFISDYPSMKSEAQDRLKDMYNEYEFPTIQELQEKFDVGVSFQPMPDAEDFRISLGQEEVEKLRTQIGLEIKDRHAQANEELYERAKDAITHIIEVLSTEKAHFKNTTIEKISELVSLFPMMNYSGDKKLDELTEQMKSLIVEPENLRKDAKAKESYVARAKELEKMFF